MRLNSKDKEEEKRNYFGGDTECRWKSKCKGKTKYTEDKKPLGCLGKIWKEEAMLVKSKRALHERIFIHPFMYGLKIWASDVSDRSSGKDSKYYLIN